MPDDSCDDVSAVAEANLDHARTLDGLAALAGDGLDAPDGGDGLYVLWSARVAAAEKEYDQSLARAVFDLECGWESGGNEISGLAALDAGRNRGWSDAVQAAMADLAGDLEGNPWAGLAFDRAVAENNFRGALWGGPNDPVAPGDPNAPPALARRAAVAGVERQFADAVAEAGETWSLDHSAAGAKFDRDAAGAWRIHAQARGGADDVFAKTDSYRGQRPEALDTMAGLSSSVVPALFAEELERADAERILPAAVELHLTEPEREQYLKVVYHDDPSVPKTWMFTRLNEQQKINAGLVESREPLYFDADQLVHVSYVRSDLPDSGVHLGPVMAVLDALEGAGRWFNQWYAAALQSAGQLAGSVRNVIDRATDHSTWTDPETGELIHESFNRFTGQFTYSETPKVGEWVVAPVQSDDAAEDYNRFPHYPIVGGEDPGFRAFDDMANATLDRYFEKRNDEAMAEATSWLDWYEWRPGQLPPNFVETRKWLREVGINDRQMALDSLRALTDWQDALKGASGRGEGTFPNINGAPLVLNIEGKFYTWDTSTGEPRILEGAQPVFDQVAWRERSGLALNSKDIFWEGTTLRPLDRSLGEWRIYNELCGAPQQPSVFLDLAMGRDDPLSTALVVLSGNAPAVLEMRERAMDGATGLELVGFAAQEAATRVVVQKATAAVSSVVGVLARKAASKLTALAEANINNSGKTVLGHWPGYIDKAKAKGASFFNIGKAWGPLTDPERRALNRHFLDIIAAKGDTVYLSVPKSQIKPGSWLAEEVEYLLKDKGYRWVNQWVLAKP